MKNKLNLILLLIFTFMLVNQSSAQMTVPCSPCPAPCVEVDVINYTGCDLEFCWGYGGCTYPFGAKWIFANTTGCFPPNPSPFPTCRMYGPCAKCPGDLSECECPDKIFIRGPGGILWWPWGNFNTMIANGNSSYVTPPLSQPCPGCLNGVRADIVIGPSNLITITFTCL